MLRGLVVTTVAVLLISVLVAGYVIYPFWTLYRLQQATKDRDADAIEALIDWPQVRGNFKADFRLTMLERAKPDTSGFAALGGMLGASLVDGMLDAMISPAGMRKLFAGSAKQQSPMVIVDGARLLSPTMLRANMHLPEKPEIIMVLTLELAGGVWRLTRVDLPFDAMPRDFDKTIQDQFGKR